MNNQIFDLGKHLTRSESKKIIGGFETNSVPVTCSVGRPCVLFVSESGSSGTTYNGTCSAGWGGGSGGYMECGCETSYGPYVVANKSGHTACHD